MILNGNYEGNEDLRREGLSIHESSNFQEYHSFYQDEWQAMSQSKYKNDEDVNLETYILKNNLFEIEAEHNGKRLVRCKETFYLITDHVINRGVQRFFIKLEDAAKFQDELIHAARNRKPKPLISELLKEALRDK